MINPREKKIHSHLKLRDELSASDLNEIMGILLGQRGCGKSNIIGKLDGRTSNIDQTPIQKFSHKNNKGEEYELIEAIGADKDQYSSEDIEKLKLSLISYPINTIFIVLRLDNRFEKMLDTYIELESLVSKYVGKIVVLITNFDIFNNLDDSKFEDICKEFEGTCENIICLSKDFDSEEMSNLIIRCMKSMEKERILIEDDFIHNFKVKQKKNQIIESFSENNAIHRSENECKRSCDIKQVIRDIQDIENKIQENQEDKIELNNENTNKENHTIPTENKGKIKVNKKLDKMVHLKTLCIVVFIFGIVVLFYKRIPIKSLFRGYVSCK